ncbi:MAG: hydroxymethylbilane synthase, partial [Actinomycetota bacterium]|nr:hydroxymethylbilane synthase [Actinomycetota bacterium]
PVGALAWIESGRMRVRGFCALPDASEWIRDATEGDPTEPEGLGAELAERMKGAGAEELLQRAERMAESLGLAR